MTATPGPLFPALVAAQSPAQAQCEILRLLAARDCRLAVPELLRACLQAGVARDNPHVLAATWSQAKRAATVEGMKTLPRQLAELWDDLMQGDHGPTTLPAYVQIVLGGEVSRLWTEGLGNYESYLGMWRTLSFRSMFPAALGIIKASPAAGSFPAPALVSILNGLSKEGYWVEQVLSQLPLEGREDVLDAWLSSAPEARSPAGVLVALRRPGHAIWADTAFHLVCATKPHPPAFDRLVASLDPPALARYTDLLLRSTAAALWTQAMARHQAAQDGDQLDQSTRAIASTRPAPRL